MSRKQVVLNSQSRYNTHEGANQMREEVRAQYTRDVLQQMSDRDLSSAENTLIRKISSLRKESRKTYEQEIDLCYVQDEIFRRSSMASSKRRRS